MVIICNLFVISRVKHLTTHGLGQLLRPSRRSGGLHINHYNRRHKCTRPSRSRCRNRI